MFVIKVVKKQQQVLHN